MQVRGTGHLPVMPGEVVAGFQVMNRMLCPVCKQCFTELKLGPFLNHCNHCKGDVTQREVNCLPQGRFTNSRRSQQKHPCPLCPKVFRLVGNLNVHLRIHWGCKPHRCEQCDKRFSRKSNLIVHLRTHSGEKPYVCQRCDKRFSQKGNLGMHLRTHTGYKPHICELCHKSFTQRCNLNEHMRVHTGERPYKCSQCHRGFTRKTYLENHKSIHMNDKSYECGQARSLVANKQSGTTPHGWQTYERKRRNKACSRKSSLKSHRYSIWTSFWCQSILLPSDGNACVWFCLIFRLRQLLSVDRCLQVSVAYWSAGRYVSALGMVRRGRWRIMSNYCFLLYYRIVQLIWCEFIYSHRICSHSMWFCFLARAMRACRSWVWLSIKSFKHWWCVRAVDSGFVR